MANDEVSQGHVSLSSKLLNLIASLVNFGAESAMPLGPGKAMCITWQVESIDTFPSQKIHRPVFPSLLYL